MATALKHHTSKLRTFEDLESVTTFGFRGEALSSLCALADFHIVTATASEAPKGNKLEFEMSGKLKSKTMVATSKGTTVCVGNLYKTLPVRRMELERTIKREYSKVLGMLQAYASICVGVKFSVFNQPPKGFDVCCYPCTASRMC
jgi:DNA mismatch repair protein PMS2